MMKEGLLQVRSREYAKSYASEGRRVIAEVLVADDEKKQIVTA